MNSRLVKAKGPAVMAGVGCGLGFAGAVLLWAATGFEGALPAVILGLFVVVSMTGLLGANCVGLLMARYPQNAGAAAALFGASQFGLGMLASATVSYVHSPDGRGMAWVIVVVSGFSLLGWLGFRRYGERRQ